MAGRVSGVRLGAIGGAVACFLLLGASSCGTSQLLVPTGKPTLRFVGDSITAQATDDINAHYGGSWDIGINAVVGIDTYMEAATVAADAASAPDVEVVNLGTNDASEIAAGGTSFTEPTPTLDSVISRLDTFATEFPASTCVVFVNVDAHNPSWGPVPAQAIDDHMAANPAIYPHVVDWNDALQPGYFDLTDNPHPNETGRQAMLALEDTAIAGCTAGTSTSTTTTTTTTTTTIP